MTGPFGLINSEGDQSVAEAVKSGITAVEESVVLPGQMKFSWGMESDPDDTASDSANVESKKSKKAAKANVKKKTKSTKKSVKKNVKAPAKKKTKAVKKPSSAKKKSAPVAKPVNSAKKKPTTKNTKSSVKKKTAKPVAQTEPSVSTATTLKPSGIDHSDRVECFDMKWGSRFPKVGFGFWKVEQEKTAEICKTAIKVGYRHLDCACDYGNEVQVGEGIAAAISDGICEREDLWITSKLWNTYHAPHNVHQACERSLNDLGVDYLDLYLIHFPIAQRFVPFEKRYPPGWFFDPNAPEPVIEEERIPLAETWQAMEDLAKSGLVKNIGICNVGTSQLRDLLTTAKIRPSVLQVESHPNLTQEKLLKYCNQERIVYTAFSPLGAQSYFSIGMADPSESVMQEKVIVEIAKATGRTAAQGLLRWGVQRGTAVIPKTSNFGRIEENIDIFDFALDQKQMDAISALDKGRRFNDPGDFAEAAFNTYLPIYE